MKGTEQKCQHRPIRQRTMGFHPKHRGGATYNDASREGNDAIRHRRHQHQCNQAELSLGIGHHPPNNHKPHLKRTPLGTAKR